MTTPAHLGGHGDSTNIDAGALDWFIAYLNRCGAQRCARVLDIGAGMGHMKALGHERGLTWTTVDGDPACEADVVLDFTRSRISLGRERFAFCWCVEFLEHIDALYLDNVFDAFSLCDWVVCTAAPPGHGGYHHVNEQHLGYWVTTFWDRGWELDIEASAGVRAASLMTIQKPHLPAPMEKPFMRERGMVFRRAK